MSRPQASRLSLSIVIGNLPFTFSFPSLSWHSLFIRNYRPFISSAKRGAPKIAVSGKCASKGTMDSALNVSANGNGWALNRSDFSSRSDAAFARTALTVEKNRYSFDSWLRVFSTLCGLDRESVLIHGAGYALPQRSFLFPGRSGRGKSTLIRILGKDRALSDELTLLYRRHTEFHCASTPFWGELKRGNGKVFDAPLRAFCFLAHGDSIRLEELSSAAACRELLKTVLFFSDDTRLNSELLSLCASASAAVPAYRLVFTKNACRNDIMRLLASL